MILSEFTLTLIGALVVGVSCGFLFWELAKDHAQLKTFMRAAVFCSLLGWTVGLFLPVTDFKALGVLAFAALFAFDGSFLWWARYQ